MSYYIDPWLYNCADNPADTPEQQQEQRTIVKATNRALDYADKHGVTLIAAEGNENTNLDNFTFDDTSPDYPLGTNYPRNVNDSCLSMPSMGHHVINVGAVGPTTMKSDFSNWGFKYTNVTAPGGYFRDGFGTPLFRTVDTQVLSAMPTNVAIAEGDLNPDGSPNTPFVVRECQRGVCAYYQYLQGTSMASPHAVGVAALIVSQYGKQASGSAAGQLTMDPDDVAARLRASATDHACPVPALVSYAETGRPPDFDALCVGTTKANNFYGDGIVNALAAVTGKNP
jgi:subtilisin family serine protease